LAKRKKKEHHEETNGTRSMANITARLFDDQRNLHEIRLACGHLKRVAAPGPEHLQKFIDRVFTIAGVEQGAEINAAEGAQS
jgi:hypothetical protein